MAFRKYDEKGNPEPTGGNPLGNFEDTLTEQSHEKETNINEIVKKHGAVLSQGYVDISSLRFDDVSNNDFQEMVHMLMKGKESFEKVPSVIRNKFENDPAKFMDFVHNPDSKDQLVEWGMLKESDPPPSPIKVVMVDDKGTPVEAEPAPIPE